MVLYHNIYFNITLILGLYSNRSLFLVQALPSMGELSELDMSSNKNVGGAIRSLLPILPLSKMKRLHLNNCGLSAETCQALGKK